MKTAGIIAEYNPFHLGHSYHIEETRRLTGADYIIIIMSGNFTQRGRAAIMDKYSRAEYALKHGADLVLELPVCFAASSARYFAFGAVSLLSRLGVVDYLSFGSESGNLEIIQKISAFLEKEPAAYRDTLCGKLKEGFSYPGARAYALQKHFPQMDQDFLSHPNNILGIEYCNALLSFNSPIKPVTLKRLHSSYHDTALSPDGFSSATSIRQTLREGISDTLAEHLPACVYQSVTKEYGLSLPISTNDFSSLLHYRLLSGSFKEYALYADVHEDLARRIENQLFSFTDFEAFCDLLKTKELTHSRISRALLHILLGIKQEELKKYKEEGYCRYGRILGLRRDAGPLLSQIKAHTCLPLISKLADARPLLDSLSLQMLETDIRSSHIYESVLSRKFSAPFRNEYSRQFPVL